MPRVHHVKKARHAYKEDGIKKGESYYWWKFRGSSKTRSKVAPKPSQLTQSPFMGAVYELQEEIANCTELEELQDIAQRIRELGEEQEEKKNNMPEPLQEAHVGELLTERQEACETWADELEAVEDIDEATNVNYEGS